MVNIQARVVAALNYHYEGTLKWIKERNYEFAAKFARYSKAVLDTIGQDVYVFSDPEIVIPGWEIPVVFEVLSENIDDRDFKSARINIEFLEARIGFVLEELDIHIPERKAFLEEHQEFFDSYL